MYLGEVVHLGDMINKTTYPPPSVRDAFQPRPRKPPQQFPVIVRHRVFHLTVVKPQIRKRRDRAVHPALGVELQKDVFETGDSTSLHPLHDALE